MADEKKIMKIVESFNEVLKNDIARSNTEIEDDIFDTMTASVLSCNKGDDDDE